ncbi:MAG TPA: PspC domain-containing protein, partial [Roseiflexaceae bacterium]|nr:PspC domain-containing protein [Roseiflexaceae bacterium]
SDLTRSKLMSDPTQRLMRSRTEKVIAGVAGGIGQYLAIDPVIVRLAFAALCLTGLGVVLYPILWLIMPLEGSQRPAPREAVDEMRQQAMRLGDEAREVFVAPGSASRQPRYDPMTGASIDPEAEIPINNVNTTTPAADPRERRNRVLGFILLGVGAFILINMLPGFGHVIGLAARFVFPLLLIAVGVLVLRRKS